jgi:twitching motility protein PilT
MRGGRKPQPKCKAESMGQLNETPQVGQDAVMDMAQLQQLLVFGVKNGASDIHFRPGDAPTYRVNGELHPLKDQRLTAAQTRSLAAIVIQDDKVQANLDTLQEFDGSYALPGVARFRVNIYRQRGSLSLVMRIIPPQPPTLDQLGLPAVIARICSSERGLVLVTGATGSGKTSTLAAMVDHINKNARKHIVTIEDPIEYLHANHSCSISQREIGVDTKNFTVALRAALRQDPDVILVGELRDPETVDIALKAAETGHLVMATVHTVDASSTITRLISLFPTEEQLSVRLRLADVLKASVSQRLLPRSDGRGRVLAQEILVQTGSVQEHIRDANLTSSIKDVLARGNDPYGMQTFDQHLTILYRTGAVSLEAATAAASNPADFARHLNFS